MKTNLTKPLTYFIIGPPRAGTTIVCNLFNALEDGFCLGEPHWLARSQGWRGYSVEAIFDNEIAGVLSVFSATEGLRLAGYKETYRLRHRLSEWLTIAHKDRVDFFLIILRDPVLVHSSQRALGWIEWDKPVDHNTTYRRLDELAQHEKAIVSVYEDFVKDPLGYLNKRLSFKIDGSLKLKPTGHTFGDPFANRSTEIVKSQRRICLSDDEVAQHREVREIWKKWKDDYSE